MTIKRIKNIRKQLGWSQIDLANYMNLSAGAVGQWETGAKKPNPIHEKVLKKLESRLNKIRSEQKKQKFINNLTTVAIGGGIVWLIAELFKDDIK